MCFLPMKLPLIPRCLAGLLLWARLRCSIDEIPISDFVDLSPPRSLERPLDALDAIGFGELTEIATAW